MSHFLGIITRKYFILTHLYCKTSFALHMTFYASRSIHIVLLFRFLLFLHWILISFQDPVKVMKIDELNLQNEAYDHSDKVWQHKWVTFWHKIYYIDSFVLQKPHLLCIWLFMLQSTLYSFSDFLYFCISFELVSKIL